MPEDTPLRRVFRLLLACAMIGVGVLHFVQPEGFVKIVPRALPAPLLLVQVSGFFEILGGAGLLVARVHRAAAFGLIALYVAVFPANVKMALDGGMGLPPIALWGRLPFQLVFIAWAWWLSRPAR